MLRRLCRFPAALRPIPRSRPAAAAVNWRRSFNADTTPPLLRWYDYLLGASLALTVGPYVYYTNEETVPVTMRRRKISFPPSAESRLGQAQFDLLMAHHRETNSVLPDDHPDTVRVKLILDKILNAMPRPFERPPGIWDKLKRTCGRNIGNEWTRDHLKGLNWDVAVVKYDGDILDGIFLGIDKVDTLCLPGGNIVVYTSLLDCLESDDEIATVIGHGLGHVIARHTAEKMTKSIAINLVHQFLLKFSYNADDLSRWSLRRALFSPMEEEEADRIRDMLLAPAGYDPRLAPKLKQKLCRTRRH